MNRTTIFFTNCMLFIFALLSTFLIACENDDEFADTEDVGEALLAIEQIPSDVYCLRIKATGQSRTETMSYEVNPGDSSIEFEMTRLPLGKVTFEADAFEEACDAVAGDSISNWISEPVDVSIVKGQVTRVPLIMKRNGRSEVNVDFYDEPACSAIGDECIENEQCCSGVCADGFCSEICEEVDYAYNPNGTGYPDPVSESDAGWGGGSYHYEILDSNTQYMDTWSHGLAFTGGAPNYNEPCGTRQMTVVFDGPKTFHRILVYHHGYEHVPTNYSLLYWDGSMWVEFFTTNDAAAYVRSDLETFPADGWGSVPTENVFSPITSNKVRFQINNNCDIEHGWLYEINVIGC